MPNSLNDFLDLLNRGGVVLLLGLIIWGAWNDKWVTGATHQRVLKERDEYRNELLATLRVADRATRVTERTVDIADARLEAQRRLRQRSEDPDVE